MAQFGRIDSRQDPPIALVMTQIWINDIPIDVSKGVSIDYTPPDPESRSRFRRRKLRFPSRLRF